jgi:hypothetical protein
VPLDPEIAAIDLLLSESHGSRFRDPERMVYLAELAQAAANRLDPTALSAEAIADVHARVWAELGNAYRVADALDHSYRAFDQALDAFERGSGDVLLLALIADRLASLLSHLRRDPEAFALLEGLAAFHVSRSEWHLAGRALILRGVYAQNAGDPEGCILYTARGLGLITASREPTLILNAVHNLLCGTTDLGHFLLVNELIPKVRHLYEGAPLQLLRLRWLEGRVAAGLNNLPAASQAFKETRAGFSEAGLVFPTCVVSLDLALVLTRQRRWRDIVPLAEEMLAGFRALRVGREAILTLLLLRRACQTGGRETTVVSDCIRRLKTFLEEHQGRSS